MRAASVIGATLGGVLWGGLLLLCPGRVLAIDTVSDYQKSPAFVTSPVQPLTMLLLDNTGSMGDKPYASTSYSATKSYYGLFEQDKYYYHPFAQGYTNVCDYTGISGHCEKVTGQTGDCQYPQRDCTTQDPYYTCYRPAKTSGPYATTAGCTSACVGGSCATASYQCDTAAVPGVPAVPAKYMSPVTIYDPVNDGSKRQANVCDGTDNKLVTDCSGGPTCTTAYACYSGTTLKSGSGYFGNATCDNGSGNVCTTSGYTCKPYLNASSQNNYLCYTAPVPAVPPVPASSRGPFVGACNGVCTGTETCAAKTYTCNILESSDGNAYKGSSICDGTDTNTTTDCNTTSGFSCTTAYRCAGSTVNYGTSDCNGVCAATDCKAYITPNTVDWSGKDCGSCTGSCAATGTMLVVANPTDKQCNTTDTWCSKFSGSICTPKDLTSSCVWTDWVARATCVAGGGTCVDQPEVPDVQGSCTTATDQTNCATKYHGVCNKEYYDTTSRASYWRQTPTSPDPGGAYTDSGGTVTLGNQLNHDKMSQMDIAKKVLIGGKKVPPPVENLVLIDGDSADILLQPGEDPKGILQNYEGLAWGFGVLNAPTGGIIKNYVGSANADIVQAINDTPSSGMTDLAEALNSVVNYFKQAPQEYYGTYSCKTGSNLTTNTFPSPWCNNTNHTSTNCLNSTNGACIKNTDTEYSVNTSWDPYYDKPSQSYTPCGRGSVILITDGEPNEDESFNATIKDYAFNYGAGIADFAVPAGVTYTCATGGGTYGVPSCDNTNLTLTKCSNGSNCNSVTTTKNSYYLDDVSFWAHTHDLRPESAMGGDTGMAGQRLDIYSIYAFGNDATMKSNMQKSAVLGGFDDKNSDGKPNRSKTDKTVCGTNADGTAKTCEVDKDGKKVPADQREWDFNDDGIADNYADASEGDQLAVKLQNMLGQIQQKVSAGSAASVISASRSGEGAIYQATFYPKTPPDAGHRTITWVGDLHSMWLDDYGNMREDCAKSDTGTECTAADGILNTKTDKILEFYSDPTNGEAMVRLFKDENGDSQYISGTCSVSTGKDKFHLKEFDCTSNGGVWNPKGSPDFIVTITMKDFSHYLWSGGRWLAAATVEKAEANRVYEATEARRYIFTQNEDITGTPVPIPFTTAQLPLAFTTTGYKAYLNAATTAEADKIVNYVRGVDYSEYRSRLYDWAWGDGAKTNRLGDIVGSTPTIVTRPAEDYDQLYQDKSYQRFRQQYDRRRIMVYSGGNDGGLHAFNGGYFNRKDNKFEKGPPGKTEYDLGSEMWMFIPKNLLPHLQWLTKIDYSHTYYVDMKPYVFDAKIFTPSSTHPDGWGTVLVGGMGFGGGDFTIDVDGNGSKETTLRSAYFLLDITDPESPPVVLSEFTHPQLGFTLAAPTAIPMLLCNRKLTAAAGGCSESGSWPMDWYLALGSGPHNNSAVNPTGIQTALLGKSDQAAQLFVLKLGNGVPALEAGYPMTLTTGLTTTPAGFSNSYFSDIVAVDYDLDFKTDVMYLGSVANAISTSPTTTSYTGGMHRLVTGESTNTSLWTLNTMFNSGKPVSAAAIVSSDGTRAWVFFGTGRMLEPGDKNDTSPQAYFGLKESYDSTGLMNLSVPNGGELVDLTNVYVENGTGNLYTTGTTTPAEIKTTKTPLTLAAKTFQQLNTEMSELKSDGYDKYNGWKIGFPELKERNLGQATLLADILTFTTYIPSNEACTGEGESALWAAYYRGGTAYEKPVIGVGPQAGGKVENLRRIGKIRGMTLTPSIHSGAESGTTALIQTSTGAIISEKEDNPGLVKSGVISWRDKGGE